MKNITQEQQTAIFNFLNKISKDICITDYVNIEDIDENDAFNSIVEKLQDENGFDCEVIYYASAIEYLKENDPSLRESLELASDLGFELKNLTSETLASLLKTENVRNNFQELETEINDFFNELFEEENY